MPGRREGVNPARPWDYRDKSFDTLCRRAGVEECGYHALRHAKASALGEEGWSLADIQAFLGHESAVTTAIYLHSLGIKNKNGTRKGTRSCSIFSKPA